MQFLKDKFAYPEKQQFPEAADYKCARFVFVATLVGYLSCCVVLLDQLFTDLVTYDTSLDIVTLRPLRIPELHVCHRQPHAVKHLHVSAEVSGGEGSFQASTHIVSLSEFCNSYVVVDESVENFEVALYHIEWNFFRDCFSESWEHKGDGMKDYFNRCVESNLTSTGIKRMVGNGDFATGFTFRLSLRNASKSPIADKYETWAPLQVGVPRIFAAASQGAPGTLILTHTIVQEFGAARGWFWKDVFGGRRGANQLDTDYLQKYSLGNSQEVRRIDVKSRFDSPDKVEVQFDLSHLLDVVLQRANLPVSIFFTFTAQGYAETVYVNHVATDFICFCTRALSGTMVFGLLSSLFFYPDAKMQLVQKRFRFQVCGLGRLGPGSEEASRIELSPAAEAMH